MDIATIGVIHSPFTSLSDMPIQSVGGMAVEGVAELLEQYGEGLADLQLFSHIYLLYSFHKASRTEMKVVPFMDSTSRGIFATRSPLRPSRIGISIVELLTVEGNRVTFKGCDILDGTPLLDIKPYIPAFDHCPEATSGWLGKNREEVEQHRSDSRFK